MGEPRKGFLDRQACGKRIGALEEAISRVEAALDRELEFLEGCDYVDGHALKEASRAKITRLQDELHTLRSERNRIIADLKDEIRW